MLARSLLDRQQGDGEPPRRSERAVGTAAPVLTPPGQRETVGSVVVFEKSRGVGRSL